jgi:predicted DNA-binding protein
MGRFPFRESPLFILATRHNQELTRRIVSIYYLRMAIREHIAQLSIFEVAINVWRKISRSGWLKKAHLYLAYDRKTT